MVTTLPSEAPDACAHRNLLQFLHTFLYEGARMDVEDSLPYLLPRFLGLAFSRSCMDAAVQMDLLDAVHQIHFALLHSCSVDLRNLCTAALHYSTELVSSRRFAPNDASLPLTVTPSVLLLTPLQANVLRLITISLCAASTLVNKK